jgi:N-acetylmuramic acid 6-phosphate etherase
MTERITEGRNPKSMALDAMSPLEIVDLMNDEDRGVVGAVRAERERIARGIEILESVLAAGGRVFFVGAGTSGRLGTLEAAECPPTFGTDPERIRAIMAGGREALWRSVEGAEDRAEDGAEAVARVGVESGDGVIGIAASGVTPFVLAAMEEAMRRGARTVLVTCNPALSVPIHPDLVIAPLVGPEVVTGSTRLKSGTATKMILNMLTTGAMVRLGKVFSNLMVDLRPTSRKLRERAVRILREMTGLGEAEAVQTLERADWRVKVALLMALLGVKRERAEELLRESGGRLREVVGSTPGASRPE